MSSHRILQRINEYCKERVNERTINNLKFSWEGIRKFKSFVSGHFSKIFSFSRSNSGMNFVRKNIFGTTHTGMFAKYLYFNLKWLFYLNFHRAIVCTHSVLEQYSPSRLSFHLQGGYNGKREHLISKGLQFWKHAI